MIGLSDSVKKLNQNSSTEGQWLSYGRMLKGWIDNSGEWRRNYDNHQSILLMDCVPQPVTKKN